MTFTHDQLDHYQDCTFFNKKEILKWVLMRLSKRNSSFSILSFRVYKKFRNLSPDIVPLDMTTPESSKIRVPKEKIIKLSELLENPYAKIHSIFHYSSSSFFSFKERICESFSKDGLGNLNFEEVRE